MTQSLLKNASHILLLDASCPGHFSRSPLQSSLTLASCLLEFTAFNSEHTLDLDKPNKQLSCPRPPLIRQGRRTHAFKQRQSNAKVLFKLYLY